MQRRRKPQQRHLSAALDEDERDRLRSASFSSTESSSHASTPSRPVPSAPPLEAEQQPGWFAAWRGGSAAAPVPEPGAAPASGMASGPTNSSRASGSAGSLLPGTTAAAVPQRLSSWWSGTDEERLKKDDDYTTSTATPSVVPASPSTVPAGTPHSQPQRLSAWWTSPAEGEDSATTSPGERAGSAGDMRNNTTTGDSSMPPTTPTAGAAPAPNPVIFDETAVPSRTSKVLGVAGAVAGVTVSAAASVVMGTARVATGVVAGGVTAGVPGAVGGLASAAVGVAVGGVATATVATAKAGASVSSAVVRGLASYATGSAATNSKKDDSATPDTPTAAEAEQRAAATSTAASEEDGKESLKCAECAALFSYRLWRYVCPSCQQGFCSACLTNRQRHRVPKRQLHEPVAVCRACFFTTCVASCGGKCFGEWPVTDLKQFMASRGIVCTGVEKHDLVRSICDWGAVNRIASNTPSGFSQPRGQGLSHLSVEQLRQILDLNGVNHSTCIEKRELIGLVQAQF